jgi:formylglycine-generating enzyme required for sulfatase activity
MKKIFILLLAYTLIFNLLGCSLDSETIPETIVAAELVDTSLSTTLVEIKLPTDTRLIDIPSDLFEMGGTTNANDAPVVSVTVSDFAISDTEVTNAQYIEFLNAAYNDGWLSVELQQVSDPCGNSEEYMIVATDAAPHSGEIYLQLGETGGCTSDGHAEHIDNKSWIRFINESFELVDEMNADWPANWIKWYGADAFAPYYEISLPTEAQWEYAAKGGYAYEYPTDNGLLDDSKANYNGDTPGVYNAEGHSVAVRSYPANPFGLYDMGGNVWEWCAGYYAIDFYLDNTSNPLNTTAGIDNKRVRRGGSWNYHAATLSSHARASDFENRGNNHFGFRAVKNLIE